MHNWAYYKMVRHDDPEVLKNTNTQQTDYDSLKELVSKFKYAIMDEDDEMIMWFETYDEAEAQVKRVMKACDNKWKRYIVEVTDEMREKVINS